MLLLARLRNSGREQGSGGSRLSSSRCQFLTSRAYGPTPGGSGTTSFSNSSTRTRHSRAGCVEPPTLNHKPKTLNSSTRMRHSRAGCVNSSPPQCSFFVFCHSHGLFAQPCITLAFGACALRLIFLEIFSWASHRAFCGVSSGRLSQQHDPVICYCERRRACVCRNWSCRWWDTRRREPWMVRGRRCTERKSASHGGETHPLNSKPRILDLRGGYPLNPKP